MLPQDLDTLTQRRLARLNTMPVDVSRVASRLRSEIGSPRQARTHRLISWGPYSAAAALVLVAVLVGLAMLTTANPVVASPAELQGIHRLLMDGQGVAVGSVEAAEDELRRRWANAPAVPLPLDARDIRACHVPQVQGKNLAAILLVEDGSPLTLVVGNSREIMCHVSHDRVVVEAREFFVHTGQDGINMVMQKQGNRWACLMGERPVDELLATALNLQW